MYFAQERGDWYIKQKEIRHGAQGREGESRLRSPEPFKGMTELKKK